MLKIKEAIVVEGRYDKNTLCQVVDTAIIETSGFGIFKDEEKRRYLRLLAEKRGIIILTDSDGAGFLIRNHLKGCLDPRYVKNAYIPDVMGKEKRKSSPSKEGKLGVEGMSPQVIIDCLRRAGATFCDGEESSLGDITKAGLYSLGLSGGSNSANKRRLIQKRLGLPERMTANGLLEALNTIMDYAELKSLLEEEYGTG